jgi:hypothetical protein
VRFVEGIATSCTRATEPTKKSRAEDHPLLAMTNGGAANFPPNADRPPADVDLAMTVGRGSLTLPAAKSDLLIVISGDYRVSHDF